jgi:NitT/TauT family transport system substrate-binding protein
MREAGIPRRIRTAAVLGAFVLGGIGGIAVSAGASTSPRTTAAPRISAAECAANRAAGTVTFVSPFGFGPGPGLIENFIAQKLGYFATECLKVNIVTSSYTPNELVSSGTGTFTSEGSAADALEAVASGSNLVSIATYADTSTYVLLTSPTITNLKQLAGKTLGYHTAMPVILTEMLKNAGVNLGAIQLINDTSYDPTLLTQGKFSALQAYEVNEPLTLTADHLKFKEWYPAQYKAYGTFNTVVVNGTFLKKHPTAVADFLRAELHAINYCEGHALACIKIEEADAAASGAVYDVEHSVQELNLSIHLVKEYTLPGKGIGVETKAEWAPEVRALEKFGIVKKVPSLDTYENTTIAPSLYDGTKLIWPGP